MRLVDDIAALLRKNDASGTLKSNDTLMQSTLLCCEMLQNRLDVCLSTLKDFLSNSKVAKSDIGPVELKELVAEFFCPLDPFVRDQLSEVIITIEAPDVLDKLYGKVERTRSHVLTRLGVEIDILCRRAKADKASFWQAPWFRKAMLVTEVSCSLATAWFAYVWIYNPGVLCQHTDGRDWLPGLWTRSIPPLPRGKLLARSMPWPYRRRYCPIPCGYPSATRSAGPPVAAVFAMG